jgi:hypothetical protein
MKINRHGSAQWQGGIKEGRGAITTESGALKAYPHVGAGSATVTGHILYVDGGAHFGRW